MNKLLISIYKSPRRDEMYLYVNKQDRLDKVPEALSQSFGTAEHVMDMLLTPERKLARADTEKVIEAIRSNGFYLQMPPAEEEYIEHLPEELLGFNDPL
ncbi:MAG: YcgL domain-containing protein [Endozoicomonas sp.]